MANFATGFQAGVGLMQARDRRERDKENQTWLREDRERELGMRKTAESTLGRIGTETTSDYQVAPGATGSFDDDGTMQAVKTPYTARQGYEDYARGIAKYDPMKSAQARGLADAEEVRGLQATEARRVAAARKLEDDYFKFERETSHLPDDQWATSAAAFATNTVKDGRSFGYDPESGSMFMINPDGTAGQRKFKDRNEARQELMKYISPQMYDRVSRERNVDADNKRADRGQQIQEDNLIETRGLRREVREDNRIKADQDRASREAMASEMRADRREARAARTQGTPLNEAQRYDLEQRRNFDRARQEIAEQVQQGMPEAEARRRLNIASVKYGGQIREPSAGGRTGLRAVGNGLYADERGEYRMDERTNELVPLKRQGPSLLQQYQNAAGSQPATDGLPSAKSPDSFRRGLPPRAQQRVQDPITGESIMPDEYRRKYGRNP